MSKTIDRLMLFIDHLGVSARKFDMSIGASNGYTLRMVKNHASIGSDVIERILKTYPELNVVWLITGDGVMLNSQKEEEILDFEKLPRSQQKEIERIIENKIQERRRSELKEIILEVQKEIKG